MPPVLLSTLFGCMTAATSGPVEPKAGVPAAEPLRALMTSAPRHGVLVVTPSTLELRLGRADRSRPFLSLQRAVYTLACARMPSVEDVDARREEVWWLFADGADAVALQVAPERIDAWFWDAERACPVRVPALGADGARDAMPDDYYGADDVQVAYRWNQSTTPLLAFGRLPESDAPGVTGDEAMDFLADVEGTERLVVAASYIAILAADGRVLLEEHFDVDPDWPCYDAQLTVFRKPTGELYAISTFETFGARDDCAATGGDNRYHSAFARWDGTRFGSDYRTTEHVRPLHPAGESSLLRTDRRHQVTGGTLRVVREQLNRFEEVTTTCAALVQLHDQCLTAAECWRWSTTAQTSVELTLHAADGAQIALGTARTIAADAGGDCE